MFNLSRYILSTICLACVAGMPDVKVCQGEVPRLLLQREFSCRDMSEAVNHFVQLGETKAISELNRLGETDDQTEFSRKERVGWLCRILYEAKESKPISPPAFGGLSLPRLTMPAKDWPLSPIVKSGSSYFVLAEGYMVAGMPESIGGYIKRCRMRGKFRTERVAVPTYEESTRDLDELLSSDKWAFIKWNDSGPGISYMLSEAWTIDSLKQQLGKTEDPHAE